MTPTDQIKLIQKAQPLLAKLPAGTTKGQVWFPGADGVGGIAIQFLFQEGCWVYDQQLNTHNAVLGQPMPEPGTIDVQAHTKNAVVRLWALARELKRNPDNVRRRFEQAWGLQLGGHIHDKVHYHYKDEVDDWWCSLDDRNREKFLTHRQTDFS